MINENNEVWRDESNLNMISLIIPSFNDSQDLVKTTASCLVQNHPIEVIIVDDFSLPIHYDAVYKIKKALQEVVPFIRLEIHIENKGLAESRDTGIRAAKGEYILPLDCGDWLYPHVLQDMVDMMTLHNADVVFGNMTETDGGRVHVPPGYKGITREGLLERNQLWATSMFKKSLWEKVGGYYNGLHTSYEDYAFWNKCFMAGAKFQYIDKLIYRHTANPNSMLSKLHKNTDYFNSLARQPLYG